MLGTMVMLLGPSSAFSGISKDNARISSIQIPFIENQGQIDNHILYYTSTQSGTLLLTRSGVQILLLPMPDSKSVLAIHEQFVDAKNTCPVGLAAGKTRISHYKGGDPKTWRENLPSWQKVGIKDVYPGVDYQLRSLIQHAEKIFVVRPGADPKQIRLKVEGVDRLSIGSDGSLKLHSSAGDLEYSPPVAYQEIDGQLIPVKVSYQLNGKMYGFNVGNYNHEHPLVIDPLIRSSFFGGTSHDSGYGIAVNQTSGSVYITGYTTSIDLPTTAGVVQETNTEYDQDVYVAKFDAGLTTLEAATYYGTSGWEFGAAAIALHPDGSVYLAGKTRGTDLPGAGAGYQSEYTGGTNGDAFVARLNEDLSGPPAATYLGGTGEETGISIAVNGYADHDLYGSVYIAGRTSSTDFPGTTDGFLETNQGGTDVFVAYFSPNLQTLGQASYFGGTGWDEPATDTRGQAMLIHPGTGDVLLVGWTSSNTIPGLFYSRNGAESDAFYVRLFGNLGFLHSGTYIGGEGQDMASALGIMPLADSYDVDVYVVGRTNSTYPCPSCTSPELVDPDQGGYQSTYQGGNFDAFVVRLRNASIVNSTYLGGESDDRGYGIVVDPDSERVWVTGETDSTGFPTSADADQAAIAGSKDAFVLGLSLELDSLEYGSYLGGALEDYGTAMALNEATSRVYVVGDTDSTALYGTEDLSYDNTFNDGGDAFVAVFDGKRPALSSWALTDIGAGWGADIGADGDGNLYVCYFQGDQMHIKKRDVSNGKWTIIDSYDRPDGNGFLDCAIAVQVNGGVHACMVTNFPEYPTNNPINDLWYAGPGALELEAVDANETPYHGSDGECAISLWNNMPTISYRVYDNDDWLGLHSLAVAVKPAPDQPWIVMNNLHEDSTGEPWWSDDSDYGKATALAFDSSGLPLVAFTDEDGTASFSYPSFYPPLIPTTLPEWTRYTTTHRGIPLRLDWVGHLGLYESFSLIGKLPNQAINVTSVDLQKDFDPPNLVTEEDGFSYIPEFCDSNVIDTVMNTDNYLRRHLVFSNNDQARYVVLNREEFSLTPVFADPIDDVWTHSTEVIGNDMNNCALAIDNTGTVHAICGNGSGKLIYARQVFPAEGFLSLSPLRWRFGLIDWMPLLYEHPSIKDWRTFYLTNLGGSPLEIRDVRIVSDDPSHWVLDLTCHSDFAIGMTLAPGETTAVCVRPDEAAYADTGIAAKLVVETDGHQTYIADLEAGTPVDADADSDGVPDSEEMGEAGSDGTYDGNGDGIADWEQENVASLHTYDNLHYVTIATTSDFILEDVTATDNPSPVKPPASVDHPYGFFSFVISGLAGDGATVKLYLPAGAAPESYWKYGPQPSVAASWYEFDYDGITGAQINANVITLNFTDGGRGDHDLIKNGRVVDPGAPMVLIATGETDDDGGVFGFVGGGGGGGCFISSLISE